MKTLIQLWPIVFMLGLVYLMIIVPENKRKKKYYAMIESLKVNDEVMTKGGIIGRIMNIQGRVVIIQTGPDKVRIKLDKTGVLNLLSAIEENNKGPEKKEEKKAE